MYPLVWFCALVCGIAAAIAGQVVPVALIPWAYGLVCLSWALILVTLPWNLHFEAKNVLFEMLKSKEKGLTVQADREAYAEMIRARTLKIAIAAHFLSALFVGIITYFLQYGAAGYAFAGFYLASSSFRPGIELYDFVKERLLNLKQESRYPRDDVRELTDQVQEYFSSVSQMRRELGISLNSQEKWNKTFNGVLDEQKTQTETRLSDIEKRITLLARKFEETVNSLTDNQELIAGVKSFLKLVRQETDKGA